MSLAVAALATLGANQAEISTSDLRKNAAFDNLKATWGKALNIGDFKTQLTASYDYNANKDFLKDVRFEGDLLEQDDLTVAYDVKRSFVTKQTEVTLTANSKGTTLTAEYDTDSQLTEVGASRDVDLSDYTVNVSPSWMVQAKTARVKLMSTFGSDKDSVSAQIDYDTDAQSATATEVTYDRALEDGRSVSTTYTPSSKNLEIEYTDDGFESGATWTATANVGLDDGGDILDGASVSVKRSWTW